MQDAQICYQGLRFSRVMWMCSFVSTYYRVEAANNRKKIYNSSDIFLQVLDMCLYAIYNLKFLR